MGVKGHISYPEPLLISNIYLKLEASGEKEGGGYHNLEFITVLQRERSSLGTS